jgi:hypothetical protein
MLKMFSWKMMNLIIAVIIGTADSFSNLRVGRQCHPSMGQKDFLVLK